ncbi:lamin tail domain-containing protein [Patescibacteria group bacterium]|nr:lamin tail domain-containing protein [Patescibacteria group bacterium]
MKKFFTGLCLMTLALQGATLQIPSAFAAGQGNVVINEIAWMGSIDSTNDEWIELHNTTASDIDLTNWTIDDDNGSAIYQITTGLIPANGYFLIEDTEESTSIVANAIIAISLSNTGDSLILKDETGVVIDAVNSSGGMWAAGDNTSKMSMERIDANVNGDDVNNWINSNASGPAIGRSGSNINGTPGAQNSANITTPTGTVVSFAASASPNQGDAFTLQMNIANTNDIRSYGFDLLYDATALEYISASEGAFLNETGTVATAFNADLENGNLGKVVIGNARLNVPQTGASGNGHLLDITFRGLTAETSTIVFDTPSFVSDGSGDVNVNFENRIVTVNTGNINPDPVTNLQITEGVNRYEIALTWNAPATGADNYRVMRRNTAGIFEEIGNVNVVNFVDTNKIIPNYTYEYQLIAVKGEIEAIGTSGNGIETRGIKGDNTRSDRVDGRDLSSLASHYTLASTDGGFDPLIDTTYDGIIDGSDLIDIGANWASTY